MYTPEDLLDIIFALTEMIKGREDESQPGVTHVTLQDTITRLRMLRESIDPSVWPQSANRERPRITDRPDSDGTTRSDDHMRRRSRSRSRSR